MQKADRGDVQVVQVIAVLVQDREIVHIEADHRVLHARAKAADIDGRGKGSAIVRQMHARHQRLQILWIRHAVLLQLQGRNRRHSRPCGHFFLRGRHVRRRQRIDRRGYQERYEGGEQHKGLQS